MSGSNKDFFQSLAEEKGFTITNFSSLAGGSINQVYLLETSEGNKVLKLNDSSRFPGMFSSEKEGLEALGNSGAVDVPRVLDLGEIYGNSYLLLEYKKEGTQKSDFWHSFAEGLANLHRSTAPEFGFSDSNYIGRLPQYNKHRTKASDFYIEQRLEPQFSMASKNGFSFGNLSRFYRNVFEEIPEEAPALVHGDLWSGNYIVNEEGLPCLIDPAVSYTPREMDLAMMKLFGGFPEEVFVKYEEIFPVEPGFEERVPLWQLYYLLVHLNIFGSGYLPQVKKIINQFS